jgi:hypothetical protein
MVSLSSKSHRLVRIVAVALLLTILSAPSSRAQQGKPVCWVDGGLKADFGSENQLRELQRYAKSGTCEVFAMTWRIKMLPQRQSLMLWDLKKQALYRIHVDAGARWERWSGATKAAILADDASDGLDLPSYSDGQGKTDASPEAAAFVKSHAPKKFDTAF